MIEPAYATDADRRRLLAQRAGALAKLIEPMRFVNEEEKIRLLQELSDHEQHSTTRALPIHPAVSTELVRFIVDPDPGTPGWNHPELMARATDLRDILRADPWPLPWYAVPGEELDEHDRNDLDRLADSLAQALIKRDLNGFLGLSAGSRFAIETARRWFSRNTAADDIHVRRSVDHAISLRFDGRVAVLGSVRQPALRLVTAGQHESPLDLAAARTLVGWRYAWF